MHCLLNYFYSPFSENMYQIELNNTGFLDRNNLELIDTPFDSLD